MQCLRLLTITLCVALSAITVGTSAVLESPGQVPSGVLDSSGPSDRRKAQQLFRRATHFENTDELPDVSRAHPIRVLSSTGSSAGHKGVSLKSLEDKRVAFHWSLDYEADISPKTRAWEAKLFAVLNACNFCFHEVLITIDPVHGGKDTGPKWLPTPEGTLNMGAKELQQTPEGTALLRHANLVEDKIKDWFAGHCQGTKSTDFHRQVIDYSLPDNIERLNKIFNFSDVANIPNSPWILDKDRKQFHRDFPFAWMWKNSFSHMYAMDRLESEYVFHYDSDAHPLRANKVSTYGHHQRPTYVASAVERLQRNPDVVMVVAPSCRRFSSETDEWDAPFCKRGCITLGQDRELTVVQHQEHVPYVSAEHYIADVKRMKALWPLKYWADMFDATLMYNFGDKGKLYAWMNRETSDLCK